MDGFALSLFLLAVFGGGAVLIVYIASSLAEFEPVMRRFEQGGSPQ